MHLDEKSKDKFHNICCDNTGDRTHKHVTHTLIDNGFEFNCFKPKGIVLQLVIIYQPVK